MVILVKPGARAQETVASITYVNNVASRSPARFALDATNGMEVRFGCAGAGEPAAGRRRSDAPRRVICRRAA